MLNGGLFVTSLPGAVFSAGMLSLTLSLVCGPWLIRWLRSRFTERIVSDSSRLNELHAAKQNTPTMGGLLIAGVTVVSILCFADVSSPLVWIFFLTVSAFTLLGASDDWIKLRTTRNGLTARKKLVFQCLIAFSAAGGMHLCNSEHGRAGRIAIPWMDGTTYSGWCWILWAAFVIVGSSNAVNLTDGLDGLASGCSAITSVAMAVVVCSHAGVGLNETDIHGTGHSVAAISYAALAGSSLGFLWWNRHPAKVFMGDAGSLPIGGLLAIAALSTGNELLLAIIGSVFVVETLSVMLQVGWYRRTRQRVLLCSPLHNHFVFRGVPETRIVAAFWLAAMFAAVTGLTAAFW